MMGFVFDFCQRAGAAVPLFVLIDKAEGGVSDANS